MTNFSSNYLRLCEKINYEWLNILYYTIAVPWSKLRLLTQRPFYPLILWWLDTMRILMLDQSWNFSPMWNDYFTILSVVWIKINGLIVCKIGCLHREIIVYSRNTINTCSLLSHEWWVPLIKFMMGPTIHVRWESTHLWYFGST